MNTKFEREIKDKNYTVMSNYHLRDKNISLKAKGLLSQLLSYSSDWVLTIKGLCAISKEQEKAMKNTIRELETHNYLTRQKLQDSKGRFYYKYIIHEKPKVYPGTHNPPVDNPQVEKDIQINTNNKDKLDKDLNNCINNKIIIDNNLILRKLVIGKYISKDDFEISKYDEPFIWNGYIITPEIFGNINYGYVGNAMGLPPEVLYMGGGFANKKGISLELFKGPYYGDNADDHCAVKFGIDLYNSRNK